MSAGIIVVVATVSASHPVASTFASAPMPVVLCGAAAGGAGTALALRAMRRSSSTVLLGSLVVMFGATVALGLRLPRPPGSLLAATVQALANSGARLLTSAVPVPSTLETAALPFSATWLTATGAIMLLATKWPASSALAPLTLFATSVVIVGPTDAPAFHAAAVLAVALAALLGLLGRTGPVAAGTKRSAVFGAVTIAVLLGAVTAWVGPLALHGAGSPPPDLRARLTPPYHDPVQINPLSMLAGWAAAPDTPLLEVRTSQPTRLRWVTLSNFTGVTWLPAPTYRAAGAILPTPMPSGPTTVQQEVTIARLTGGWLPVPDGTREVRGSRVALDIDTGTLAAPDGLSHGMRYTVIATPQVWFADRLFAARLPASESFDDDRSLPAGAPGRLTELARRAAGGTSSPYRQALGLEEYLRTHYRFDATALGGNGYPSLYRFLFETGTAHGGRGTSEQFATAFVVLARALGIPARVVVGFQPGTALGDGRYRVRTGDALAWPEIYLEPGGWVPFNPTPASSTANGSANTSVIPPSASPPAASPPAKVPQDEPTDPADDPVQQPTDPDRTPQALLSVAAAVGALFVATGLLMAVRLVRGALRLGRGAPGDRVIGAWLELRDGLRLAGHPPAASLAVGEVADFVGSSIRRRDHVDDTWILASARALATVVNRAGFGGVRPTAADAERAAAEARALRRALWRGTSLGRRLLWLVDPRPLWWP
jgi:transglutaminase-like putative cysteine protease